MLKAVFKVLIDSIADKSSQIAKLSMDVIKVTIEIQPLMFQGYIQKLLSKVIFLMLTLLDARNYVSGETRKCRTRCYQREPNYRVDQQIFPADNTNLMASNY